jgi:hypothetical protein
MNEYRKTLKVLSITNKLMVLPSFQTYSLYTFGRVPGITDEDEQHSSQLFQIGMT